MKMDIEEQNEPTYEDLKKFLAFYSENYLGVSSLPPEKQPIGSLEVLERKNPRAAAAGLRQAINDVLEKSFHFHHTEVESLDLQLTLRGIVTLSVLRRLYSRRYKQLLKRGYIKNDTEWYFLRSVLFDPTRKSPGEAEVLEKMVASYEDR